jgi:exopolysaccharide biosynthesis polyprenyl glycosylphosphotransferase
MALSLQSVWRRIHFAEGVGTAASPEIPVDSSTRAASTDSRPSPGLKKNGDLSRHRDHIRSGRWVQISYALIDLFLISVDGLIAFSFRFWSQAPKIISHWRSVSTGLGLPLSKYAAFLMLYAALVLLFCQSQSLYRTVRTRTAVDESFTVFKAVLFATLLLSAFIYLSGAKILSRLVVAYAGALNIVTFSAWRLWKRRIVLRRAEQGLGTRNALIVGAGRIGQALAEHFENNKLLGYSFKGFLDANHCTHPRLLGKIADLSRIARTEFADEVFITIPSERELVKSVAVEARRHRLDVKVIPDLYDGLGWNAPISRIGNFPVMELHREPIAAFGLFLKRAFDVVGSGLGLIILSPFLVLISIAIRLDSPGPALYRSQRVGKKGRRFACHKFRTMVLNADAIKHQLRHLNERRGPTFKIANDPRITRLGKFLRKFSLDELPQLWNVLKGDMSLVGPRPHPLDDYDQYSLEHLRRLDVKPGITGLWQVTARTHPSFDTNMQLDLDYIENWNLWLDLKILLRTFPALFNGSGT